MICSKHKKYCLPQQRTCMDNDIFSGNGEKCEKYRSVVVITIMFLCFDVNV